jgi:hypothetical protein
MYLQYDNNNNSKKLKIKKESSRRLLWTMSIEKIGKYSPAKKAIIKLVKTDQKYLGTLEINQGHITN